jgi:hypothetical protein
MRACTARIAARIACCDCETCRPPPAHLRPAGAKITPDTYERRRAGSNHARCLGSLFLVQFVRGTYERMPCRRTDGRTDRRRLKCLKRVCFSQTHAPYPFHSLSREFLSLCLSVSLSGMRTKAPHGALTKEKRGGSGALDPQGALTGLARRRRRWPRRSATPPRAAGGPARPGPARRGFD